MADTPDTSISLTDRRKRARYRAWHRGTQEMDLVLGHYIDARLETLSVDDLDALETLMDEQDTDLLRWVMGQEPTPADVNGDLIQQLADHQTKRIKELGSISK